MIDEDLVSTYGRCDTCGSPCDADGCSADREHAIALDHNGLTVAELQARRSTRLERLRVLSDYHGWAYADIPRVVIPERFVAVREYRSLHPTFEDACAELADQILDSGLSGDLAVYDLDTGERIDLHVTTPVVTRADEQGVMENPLEA